MKDSLRRFSFFALAVLVGASVFGFFFSAQVEARTAAGGPFCPPDGSTTNKPMCYQGQNVSAPPLTQSSYLNSGQGYCGMCATSGT